MTSELEMPKLYDEKDEVRIIEKGVEEEEEDRFRHVCGPKIGQAMRELNINIKQGCRVLTILSKTALTPWYTSMT